MARRKRYPKEVIECPLCEGRGEVDREGAGVFEATATCPDCNGTGKQEREYEPEFDKEEALDRLNDEDHPE